MLHRALQGYVVLEAALADKMWLINDIFSAADIMIGTSVRYLHSMQLLDDARCSSVARVHSQHGQQWRLRAWRAEGCVLAPHRTARTAEAPLSAEHAMMRSFRRFPNLAAYLQRVEHRTAYQTAYTIGGGKGGGGSSRVFDAGGRGGSVISRL